MDNALIESESDIYHNLKWLMFFRVLFTSLLLGSTIVLQLGEAPSPLARQLLVLYGLIAGIFLLSFIYALILPRVKQELFFAYLQTGIDTFVVTLIIFVTGSFASIFSFLYLVVIIYSSMLLFRRGSMVMAALCSIQYGVMVDLEYYGILEPFVMEGDLAAVNYAWSHVLYKIIVTMVACFDVAFLSSFLAEQTRKTKKELLALEDHVRRVEKMAYMGELLQVKPIIGMVNNTGLVENLGRARTNGKCMLKMAEMVQEYIDISKPVHLIAHYTDRIEDGEKLKDIAASHFKCEEVYLTPYTPVMSGHTGPVVALSFYS